MKNPPRDPRRIQTQEIPPACGRAYSLALRQAYESEAHWIMYGLWHDTNLLERRVAELARALNLLVQVAPM